MGFSKKVLSFFIHAGHLSSWMLLIGYAVFWVELYFINMPAGRTSPLAWILFLVTAVWILLKAKSGERLTPGQKEDGSGFSVFNKILFAAGALACLLILAVALYAWYYPPHLTQEFDALHYHYTLPRQHLVRGSFAHIPWAADDFFLLPVQFAMAPYWFATEIPNQFPQAIVFLGLVGVSVSLVGRLTQERLARMVLIVLAIFGAHHVGIQMGTAMLDLTVCYLILAALDSFLKGKWLRGSVELSFFMWSKSFFILQTGLLVMMIGTGIFIFLRIFKGEVVLGFPGTLSLSGRNFGPFMKRTVLAVAVLSVFIAGPFLAKSVYYAGTPLYPFGTGTVMINKNIDKGSVHWQSIEASTGYFVNDVKDGYGIGRGPSAFVKHFWVIAVPTKGVNNAFDYPVGLVYLLFLGPFLYYLIGAFRKRVFPVLPVYVVLFWGSWWFGSQQSRFLYIPIFLIMIVTLARLKRVSGVFLGAVVLAVGLNALSVYRAHKADFGKTRYEALRQKDKDIFQQSKEYFDWDEKGVVELDFRDVPTAGFPVKATKERLPHTLAVE